MQIQVTIGPRGQQHLQDAAVRTDGTYHPLDVAIASLLDTLPAGDTYRLIDDLPHAAGAAYDAVEAAGSDAAFAFSLLPVVENGAVVWEVRATLS